MKIRFNASVLATFIAVILHGSYSLANTISTIPFVTHYPKISYNAGYQNWGIVQDKLDIIYFANNNGLLQFNNKSWKCYPLPNKTIIRSLAIDTNDYIYAGGQNELGVYLPGEKGGRIYKSFKDLIPAEFREFDDVWEIYIHPGEGVFFLTSSKIFIYKNNKINVIRPQGIFNYVGKIGNMAIIQDTRLGIGSYENDRFVALKDTRFLNNGPISGFLDLKDGNYLIVTLKSGIYITNGKTFRKWDSDEIDEIKEYGIYSSAIFDDGRIVLGTSLNGIYILDKDKNILQHINTENGLSDNKILSTYIDRSQNLWLGLDNGIDYLHTNSPLSQLSANKIMDGAGYDIEFFGDQVIYGTSKSVFYSTINSEIHKLNQIKGPVWGFNKIDNMLFMGHHEGGFVIHLPDITKISPSWGVWLFQKLYNHPDYILAGTYTGISIYRKEKGNYRYVRDLKGFKESSRFLEQDEKGNIWVAQPYKGVFKITPDSTLEHVIVRKYGKSKGLYSDLSNYLFKVYGEIIFCSEKGVYTYNSEKDTFEINRIYENIFGDDNSGIKLFESPSGNIFYVTSNGMGLLEVKEKGLSKEIKKKPYPGIKRLMVNGFEMIYPENDSNIYIGSEKGFIHLNPQKPIDTSSTNLVLFDEISLTTGNKEKLFTGLPLVGEYEFLNYENTRPVKLTSKNNSLFFSFTSTDYSSRDYIKFRYYLEGADQNWSEWVSKGEKEYTHLQPGNYLFHVQARSYTGTMSPVTSFNFIILPPWYFTKIAKLVYALVIFAMMMWIFLFLRNKYMKQKHKVLITEEQLQQVKEEKLQAELNFKNRELISASLHIGHKNTLLSKVEREIQKVVEKMNDTDTSSHLRQIIKVIKSEDATDKEIRQFSKLFNEVHPGFMDRMKAKYPDLSGNDLKMCSYIRMNMSTKEIAAITNMTIRGVEGRRYRLRKKLNLGTDVDLTSFIIYF